MELCYTLSMIDEDQHVWCGWAAKLRRWGLGDGTATLLEAAGPLTLLAAQVVYLGQPLFSSWLPGSGLKALAGMLEDPTKTQGFVQLLRETPNREPGI